MASTDGNTHFNGTIDVDALTIGGSATTVTGVATTATKPELDAIHSQGCVAADYAKLHAATGAALASGTKGSAISTVTNSATGTQLATAINALIAALQAYNVTS